MCRGLARVEAQFDLPYRSNIRGHSRERMANVAGSLEPVVSMSLPDRDGMFNVLLFQTQGVDGIAAVSPLPRGVLSDRQGLRSSFLYL